MAQVKAELRGSANQARAFQAALWRTKTQTKKMPVKSVEKLFHELQVEPKQELIPFIHDAFPTSNCKYMHDLSRYLFIYIPTMLTYPCWPKRRFAEHLTRKIGVKLLLRHIWSLLNHNMSAHLLNNIQQHPAFSLAMRSQSNSNRP